MSKKAIVTSTSLGPQILEVLGMEGTTVTNFQLDFQAGEVVRCTVERILTVEEGDKIKEVLERGNYVLTRLEDCEPDSEDCDYD